MYNTYCYITNSSLEVIHKMLLWHVITCKLVHLMLYHSKMMCELCLVLHHYPYIPIHLLYMICYTTSKDIPGCLLTTTCSYCTLLNLNSKYDPQSVYSHMRMHLVSMVNIDHEQYTRPLYLGIRSSIGVNAIDDVNGPYQPWLIHIVDSSPLNMIVNWCNRDCGCNLSMSIMINS